MTFELPFSPGDEVFFMANNQVVRDTVEEAYVTLSIDGPYQSTLIVHEVELVSCGRRCVGHHYRDGRMKDQKVFATKEELLASL